MKFYVITEMMKENEKSDSIDKKNLGMKSRRPLQKSPLPSLRYECLLQPPSLRDNPRKHIHRELSHTGLLRYCPISTQWGLMVVERAIKSQLIYGDAIGFSGQETD